MGSRGAWEPEMLTPYNEELFVGSRFADRYQIISVVGKGSMGVVYKARHELMGRLVAIKMLRGQLQLDERSMKRFEREARAASRLDHPNIIAVHDFGLTDSRQPYLVMDFADGLTLYEIQKREPILDPQRAVHIFTQVCDALQHAHFQGVIHRDLKPSNIMITQKEEDQHFVKVFDLGIAKIAWGEEEYDTQTALTGTGEVCGSPVYLSPEQCKHETVDSRSDIYSMGVVMYELLTGVPPLMGETVYDTIYLHVHEPAPRFALVTDAEIPARLEQIVLKALAKDPNERHQTMQELKWDLQASLMQSDPILVMAPDVAMSHRQRRGSMSVSPQDVRQSTDKTERVPGPKSTILSGSGTPGSPIPAAPGPRAGIGPNTEATLKDEIRALRASVESIKAVPKAPWKKYMPLAITVAVSCIVSVGATMLIMNAGKSPQKIASPEMEAKSLMYRAPIKDNGTINDNTSPVKGDVYTIAPKAVASSPRTKRAPKDVVASAMPKFLQTPKKPEKEVVTPPAPKMQPIKPKVDPAAPAPENSNPFFSIFAPAKSVKQSTPPPPKLLASTPSKSGRIGSLQPIMPKLAPEEQPERAPERPPERPPQERGPGLFPTQQPPQQQYQQPPQQIQPALPPQPTYEDQQQAVILNNSAVQLLQSDPQSAINKLNSALKLSPSYIKARVNLGKAYHNLGNHQRMNHDNFGACNSYRLSLNILNETVGSADPATQSTQQDYQSLMQSMGAK